MIKTPRMIHVITSLLIPDLLLPGTSDSVFTVDTAFEGDTSPGAFIMTSMYSLKATMFFLRGFETASSQWTLVR